MKDFETLLQLGFAGAMAFVLVFVIWKLTVKFMCTFKEMQDDHTEDMKEIQELHRQERKECADLHKELSNDFKETSKDFDKTLQMMATTFKCNHTGG